MEHMQEQVSWLELLGYARSTMEIHCWWLE